MRVSEQTPWDARVALGVNKVLDVFDLVVWGLLYGVCVPNITYRCILWTGLLG
jgi:hypothetical protein